MPNTPAAVRQGVTVACPGLGVDTPQRVLCERLLQAIGVVAWVEDEGLLDRSPRCRAAGRPMCSCWPN